MRQTHFDRDQLLACARGELFGPGNPQLPYPPLMMIDRIVSITEEGGHFSKGQVVAELDIVPDLWFFACHFRGDPVMPGCLGLDALWQLLGFFLGWLGGTGHGRALGCGLVKFGGEVLPTSKLVVYRLHIKRVFTRKLMLGIADAELEVDGRVVYTAEDLRVGLFSANQALAGE